MDLLVPVLQVAALLEGLEVSVAVALDLEVPISDPGDDLIQGCQELDQQMVLGSLIR